MSDWTTFTDPQLLRIAATTASVPDLDAAEAGYADYLGFVAVERGALGADLVASWGRPGSAGARFVTMRAAGETDTFVRLVEAPAVADYRPLTSFGWTAFEIIVDDVHTLAARLATSPFEIIGSPRPLQFMPSIVAMQVVGPGGECLYFTMESGDRESSILPPPSGFVGRTFITVCAGEDFSAMLRWYVDHFALRERPVRQSKVDIIQRAQRLSSDETIELSAIGMRQRGNLLELDGYPVGPGRVAGPRPGNPMMLPPGNALVTLEIEQLDPVAALAIAPPARHGGAIYAGRRSCTIIGPAGELLELVEAG
ncbi:VOC family protein [Sphingomonas sp. MMSM20]|uniref:VOC family protein n=1 Tax=Sphingomonas lycopersici TaxID=2951807 RepID=UPI0022389C85|nr:VOC family protein [Sphingomonas lycopersici]MCW6528827.1 VOC family protein [Sphingomonas lycopersici]